MDLRTEEREGELLALRAEMEERLRRELEAQRQELDRELVRRAYRIGELEQSLQRAEREYRSTLSWRITRPLRALKALLAELRRG